MIKVGLIGMGGIVGAHLPFYKNNPDKVKVIACCDIIPERAAMKDRVEFNIETEDTGTFTDFTTYTDYMELLKNPEIEAVDICLPTYLHKEVTIAALKSGKHVICEKPIARSIADAKEMVDASVETGKTLMIAQCIRFSPEYSYLKELKDTEKYGKLLSANFARLLGPPDWSEGNWYLNPELSGGAILDLHIHDADFIAYCFGLPEAVSSAGVEHEGDINYVHTCYDYGAYGPIVVAEGGWGLPKTKLPFRMTFMATYERATIEYVGGVLTLYPEREDPRVPELENISIYDAELRYFYKCLEDGVKPTRASAEATLDTMRIIEAEKKSVRERATIKL